MFVALWEYEVKPGGERKIRERLWAGREWARLFRNDSSYQRTRCCAILSAGDLPHSRFFGVPGKLMKKNSWRSHGVEYQRLIKRVLA